MAGVSTSQVVAALPTASEFTLNVAQVAATYDVATASGGDVLVQVAAPYVAVSVTGLTTTAIVTDDTTAVTILAATSAATMTAGKNLTPFTTPFVLKSGKKIRFTNVGDGTGGSLRLAVQWMPLAVGATLS